MLEYEMLDCKVWAVIGANENPKKYGNMIYRKLKARGYNVYPVNPRYETVDGDTCYATLSDLPEVPDVINMVVAPARGDAFLREAASLGIRYVWLQPGTYDDDLLQLIEELELTAVQACVLVATR